MNKTVRFLSLLIIVSLSCNFATGLFTEPALVEVTGPILDMTVAASLDDQGQPVDESFTYPADQPEMVVLVRIGEVDPGPLTFSWYRVTEAGDEGLFEQTVAVEARDSAFSSGLNPGILAAGTYKVVAAFAGGSETIVWDVVEPQTDGLTAPLDTSASAAGGTPAPGPSGKTPAVVPQPEPTDFKGPRAFPLITSYNHAPQVKFIVTSGWSDGTDSPVLFKIEVSPAITGLAHGESRVYTHPAGSGALTKQYELNPCSLPEGSDLPGTSITVTTFTIPPIDYLEHVDTDTEVLGPDTSKPTVQLNAELSQPWHEGKVKEGDKIVLIAIAEELKSGGSWQEGISEVQIVKQPGDETLVIESNDQYKDKACSDKRLKRTTKEFTYVVPKGVKGDITFCAKAKDFAGLRAVEKCHTFHTGKKVAGKLNRTQTDFGADESGSGTWTHQTDADLSLTLQADGTLNGTAHLTHTSHYEGHSSECGAVFESTEPIELDLPVTGSWTENEIVFNILTDAQITPLVTYTDGCGALQTGPGNVTAMVLFFDTHVKRDGEAYTSEDQSSTNGPNWTSTSELKIRLEPEDEPAVGFSPGDWSVTSAHQTSMLLAFP